MIIDERLTSYIHSLDANSTPFFDELRKYAQVNDVPIIRREMESFIRVLLKLKSPKSLLEIGSGIAYSTLFFADNSDSIKKITTIENYPPRIEKAKESIKSYFNQNGERRVEINLIEQDAALVVRNIQEKYDFIFLDGAKAQYITMLPDLVRILEPGGILLADNVLQEGELIESRYITTRRQRTIHERMREFIYEVKHNDLLDTTIITIGDGVTLSIKK